MSDSAILAGLKDKAARGEGISKEEILWILKRKDDRVGEEVTVLANKTRARFLGKQACIHGLIEISNICRRNCLYCGIRRDNKEISRYRLAPESIVKLAVGAVRRLGYKMIVLQSAEDLFYSTEILVKIIKRIREAAQALIFLSIGERDRVSYEKFYLAGARGALFRFETSDPFLYAKTHPGASFEERLEHLRFIKQIGFLLATGPIIGLPGQTLQSLAEDLILTKDSGAVMISSGPLIAHPQTPLAGAKSVSSILMRNFIAAARLAMPRSRLPVTTAMEHLWGDDFRRVALRSGANSFMLNLTPADVREGYDIYPGKNRRLGHLHAPRVFKQTLAIINECGLELCRGFGAEFALNANEFTAGCSMTQENENDL